jgi:hypothetical protein
MISTTFTQDNSDFPNPERGASIDHVIQSPGASPISAFYLGQRKTQDKVTLLRLIYNIGDCRDKPLTQAWLDRFQTDFNVIRNAGYKLVLRFSYNWSGGGQDATKSRILGHLQQLKPVLHANTDILFFLEAGFVGNWGEWHSSSNGLDFWRTDNKADRNEIIAGLLDAVPSARMVALRYLNLKWDYLGDKVPLNDSTSFSGSARARLGHHNDCFVSSVEDHGTYPWHNDPVVMAGLIEEYKTFLAQDNLYVVQGGESCENPEQYAKCSNAYPEIQRLKYSQLNLEFNADVWARWQNGGCYHNIKTRLGHRFSLVSSSTPPSSVAGQATPRFNFTLKNTGMAALMNYRQIRLILSRGAASYAVNFQRDPRRIKPNETVTIGASVHIPANAPKGAYNVHLLLEDPRLPNRADYAIRLANTGLWNASNGYNTMPYTINIT